MSRWTIRCRRTNVRLSEKLDAARCVVRCAALIRAGHVVRVLAPEAEAERRMARRVGWRLSPDLDWGVVAERRKLWDVQPRAFPIANALGVTAWGVPMAQPVLQAEIAQRLARAGEHRRQGCRAAALMELVWVRRLRLTGHVGAFFAFVDSPVALSLMERVNRAELRAA